MISLCAMIDSKEDKIKFQRIHDEYIQTMYSVAYDIAKNYHDAEDIVQEAFVKIIHVLDHIRDESIGTQKCKNLMITITKNQAIDYQKKAKRNECPVEDDREFVTYRDGEAICLEMENFQELVDCIVSMDEIYREVLRLKVMEGFSSKEIGYILNISEINVNMRYLRARRILMKKLEEKGNGQGI